MKKILLILSCLWLLIGCSKQVKTKSEAIKPDQPRLTNDTVGIKEIRLDSEKFDNRSVDFRFAQGLLGKSIAQLSQLNFPPDVSLRDTIFEGEDESTWPGIFVQLNSEVLLLLETSWMDTKTIQRVTILSSKIITPDSIKVGDQFKSIKSGFKKAIPSMPDGYFALFGKHSSKILYFFDISNEVELKERRIDFDQIPEYLKVSEILLEIE